MSARAKSSAAAWKCNKLSLSSNKTRNISLEHPPGPGELPDGALRTQMAKLFQAQFQLAFWDEFQNFRGNFFPPFLGSLPLQFLHGVLVAWCQ